MCPGFTIHRWTAGENKAFAFTCIFCLTNMRTAITREQGKAGVSTRICKLFRASLHPAGLWPEEDAFFFHDSIVTLLSSLMSPHEP